MVPLCCALGDIHLSHTIWRKHPEITGDSVLGLKGLIDKALELGVPAVMVGDIFDTAEQRDSSLVKELQLQVSRMVERNLPVYSIQGNHDKRRLPWSSVIPGITHVGDGKLFMLGSWKARGFDYAVMPSIEASIKGMKGCDILFLHQAVRQSLPFEGAWNCDLDWLPRGIQLCCIGDIHAEQEFQLPGGTAFYTGSSHPRSWSEIQPNGHSVSVIGEDSGKLVFQRSRIPSRRFLDLFWGTFDQDAPLQVQGSSLTPCIRVTFLKELTPDVEQWIQGTGIEAHWIKVALEPKQAERRRLETQAGSMDRAALQSARLQKFITSSRGLELATDLLSGAAPIQDTILQHRAAFLERNP